MATKQRNPLDDLLSGFGRFVNDTGRNLGNFAGDVNRNVAQATRQPTAQPQSQVPFMLQRPQQSPAFKPLPAPINFASPLIAPTAYRPPTAPVVKPQPTFTNDFTQAPTIESRAGQLQQGIKNKYGMDQLSSSTGLTKQEISKYTDQYNPGYGAQHPVDALISFGSDMVNNAAGIVRKPITTLMTANDPNTQHSINDALVGLNNSYKSGMLSTAKLQEETNKLVGDQIGSGVVVDENGIRQAGAQEGAKQALLQGFQQGNDTASILPLGRLVNGVKSVSANGLTEVAKQILATNAKQGLVYGTTSTANDIVQGRGVTPESLAMNYGMPTVMGTLSEFAGVGGRKATTTVQSRLPSAIADQHPKVTAYDAPHAQLTKQLTSLPQGSPERLAIAQQIADNRLQRLQTKRGVQSEIGQGGFVAGPLAGDFSKAQKAGRVFDGVDGKPRFEVSDKGANAFGISAPKKTYRGVSTAEWDNVKSGNQFGRNNNSLISITEDSAKAGEYAGKSNGLIVEFKPEVRSRATANSEHMGSTEARTKGLKLEDVQTVRDANGNVIYDARQSVKKAATATNPTPDDISQYIKNQVKSQQTTSTISVKQKIGDFFAGAKHALVDDAVAHERYIKGGAERAAIREGVDRVRGSSLIARQFAEDNGMRGLGKLDTKNLDEFQQYLIAKRSEELSVRGIKTGRDRALDKALVESAGNKFSVHEKVIRDYSRKMLDYSVDNGLITPELRTALLKESPNYVPMNRVMDAVEGLGFQKSKQLGSLSKQTVVRKIEGSVRTVENPIESLLLNTERMVNEAQRNQVAQKIAHTNAFKENVLVGDAKPRRGYDTLSYLDNGNKTVIEVPALVAKEMKNLNSVLPGWLDTTIKVTGTPTRLLRTGATSANPIFAASNLVRDQLQTAITGSIWANFKGTPKGLVAAFHPGKAGQALRAELRRNGIIGSEYRQTYGYKSGRLMKELQAESQLPKAVIERLKHPINALADLIGTTENFTRAQQFYGTKGSVAVRSQAARNNTLNFSRSGALTRQLNKIIPFLNAGVQGGRITVKQFAERPVRTASAFAVIAGVALAARAMNESQNSDLYARLSAEEKKNNLIIFGPDAHYDPESNRVVGVLKIPMPQMAYPVMDGANNVKGKPEDFLRIAGDIFQATSGLDPSNPISQLTPTFVKPIAEIGLNKSFYTGQEIVSSYDANKKPQDMGAKYTTGIARSLSEATGAPAPWFDNIIGNLGGGLAKDLAKGLSDNPDNSKDGKGIAGTLAEGGTRRFQSAYVTSQYDIQSDLAKTYKTELGNDSGFKDLTQDEQVKILDKVDYDTKAIAGITAKMEQNKSDEIKKDLSARQKNLVENGFNSETYLKDAIAASKGLSTGGGLSASKLDTKSPAYQFIYDASNVTTGDKKAWSAKTVDPKYASLVNEVNNSLPEGMPKLPTTNAVAEVYATYQKNKADNSWSDLQNKKESQKTVVAAYKTQLTDNETFISTLSDKEILDSAQNGQVTKSEVDHIIALDNILSKLGMTPMIGNKTRYALGYGSLASGSSGGSKSTGKAALKTKIASIGKMDATTADTYKSLQSLLASTRGKSSTPRKLGQKASVKKITIKGVA